MVCLLNSGQCIGFCTDVDLEELMVSSPDLSQHLRKSDSNQRNCRKHFWLESALQLVIDDMAVL